MEQENISEPSQVSESAESAPCIPSETSENASSNVTTSIPGDNNNNTYDQTGTGKDFQFVTVENISPRLRGNMENRRSATFGGHASAGKYHRRVKILLLIVQC
jgi:hypothetical protein